jgi:hypothetical protein
MGKFNFKQKPSGAFKWFLHVLTWLYRGHLGFLMGNRFVMIETKTDWYQNLQAGNLDAVWIGSKRSDASVRFLDAEEAGIVFHDYETTRPKTATTLMQSMGVSYDGTDEGRVEMMRSIPMVSCVLA